MTKEELEKLRSTVKEWLFYTGSLNPNNYADELCKDFIEPREKRIAELERNVAYYAERAKHAELNGRDIVLENKSLGERCLQLQKDKGNLTDRCQMLEDVVKEYIRIESAIFDNEDDVFVAKRDLLEKASFALNKE